MRHVFPILLAFLVTAPLMPAQTRPQLKKKLRSMIAQAKNDTDKLFEAATFAKDHNFNADYKNLIKKILRIDKDHARANAAMGRVKFDGQWISQADYKKRLAAKMEAEFKAAGKVKINEVWVDKEQVEDAKKGVFHHDGQLVNKWEMQQFQAGKVRHPRTGRFIEASDLEKANEGLVPLDDGRWVTVTDADRFHSDKSRPWVLRTKYCYIISTVPLAELEKTAAMIDVAAGSALKVFGGAAPPPSRIAAIRIAKTTEDYQEIGKEIGTGDDVFGVYIAGGNGADSAQTIDGSDSRLVIMNYGEPRARPYFARHAAGLAMCCSFLPAEGDDVAAWFLRGVAAYASQHLGPGDSKWYAQQQQKKGGLSNLQEWFGDFKVSIDVSADAVDGNIFQAGLLIAFCLKGGDKQATDALLKVRRACTEGGKAGPAVEGLQKVLTARQAGVKAYFESLLK